MPNGGTPQVIQLHPSDNVCVAVIPLEAGSTIESNGRTIRLNSAVPMGHKMATVAIGQGEPVRKYGQIIGHTTQAIAPGDWVHTHNLAMQDFHRDHASATCIPPDPAPITDRTFLGYRRAGGRVGTRNYVAVISTVNCSASVSKYIAQPVRPGRTCGVPACGRGGGVHALQRLRPAVWRHRPRHAQPCAGGHRPAPQHRRLFAGRTGLRTGGDGLPVARAPVGADRGSRFGRSKATRVLDAGPGGNGANGGSGRAARSASCCRWSMPLVANVFLPARLSWRRTAAARTAIRESPPTRRWEWRPT